MKKLTILIVLLLPLIFSSCKKKEINHTPLSDSKGDLLILVVSDSVECAMEYRKTQSPTSALNVTPVYTMAEFDGSIQGFDITIYAYGVGIYVAYSMTLSGGYYALGFPEFQEYYSDTFVDSIPGDQLRKNEVYTVPLDTSKIDFLNGSGPEELETGWNKIKNLRIIFEYRKKYPDSKIGFLHVEKQNGEAKSYFFINKYKP